MSESTAAAVRRLFEDTPHEFSPIPLWWWSGERLTKERLEWQLERLVEGGVHNVVVMSLAPAGPLAGAPADDPAWFSEEWWQRFLDVCVAGKRLGVRIWFYDQIGFSGANLQGRLVAGNPKFAGRTLRRVTVDLAGEGELAAPSAGDAVGAYALPKAADGSLRAPILLPLEDGVARWSGGPARLLLAYTQMSAFDYLDVAACSALRDLVHGEFERRVPELLGSVIAGSFQDELPAINTWTPRLPAEFVARRGYDLLEVLPALWEEWGAQSLKVRGDFHAVRAELAQEALFEPLGRWHDERGMLLGSDQQHPSRAGYPVQSTQLYADYIATHRWYSASGNDHEGDSKVHSSMAHLYGGKRTWLEAFHSTGWGGTLEETFDWLLPWLRGGATLYNPHAVYYSTAGGWFEWAPPSTCWRQPYWQHYGLFSAAVARLCAVLSWGNHRCDIGLLHPTATVQAHLPLDAPLKQLAVTELGSEYGVAGEAHAVYEALAGDMNWFATRPGVLDLDRRDFDVLDEESIGRSTVRGGRLCIKAEAYRVVLVPACTVLYESTARQLLSLAQAGGTVVLVGARPRIAAGMGGDDEAVRSLVESDLPGVLRANRAEDVPELLSAHQRPVECNVPVLVRSSGDTSVALVTAAYPNATAYPVGGGGIFFDDYDFDPKRYVTAEDVLIAGNVVDVELWDPVTGVAEAAEVEAGGFGTRVRVRFDGGPAKLLVWTRQPLSDASSPPHRRSIEERRSRIAVLEPWTATLIPTMDNRWGDFTRPAHPGAPDLQIWALRCGPRDGGKNQAGSDTRSWPTVCATFGPHAVRTPPMPLALLPDPVSVETAAAIVAGELPLAMEEGAGWQVVEYSMSRGIHKDPLGTMQLGPKGRVPDDFMEGPAPSSGEGSQYRSIVKSPKAGRQYLLVGAPAHKQVWWNGQALGADPGGYLFRAEVDASGGMDLLELRLEEAEGTPTRPEALTLRCWWALTSTMVGTARPEWVRPRDGCPPGSTVQYRNKLMLDGPPGSAVLVAGSAAALTVEVNGSIVAQQAKVEIYAAELGSTPSYFSHDVTARLRTGENEIVLTATPVQGDAAVFLDLAVRGGGETRDEVEVLSSGLDWSVTIDGAVAAASLVRKQWADPAWPLAARRPHPLAAASWLNGDPEVGEPVLRVEAGLDTVGRREWFALELPPGATELQLPTSGPAHCFLDGSELSVFADGCIELPAPAAGGQTLVVVVDAPPLRSGGSVWDGPVTVKAVTSPSPILLGDWSTIGLASWSGAVCYRCNTARPAHGGRVSLNLGSVRGTASVRVNSLDAGARFCSPYSYDVTHLLVEGDNAVEVTVYGTLAPYLDATSPTTFAKPSQLRTGLFGPVFFELSSGEPRLDSN